MSHLKKGRIISVGLSVLSVTR